MANDDNAPLAGESASEPVSLDLDAAASALEALENPTEKAAPDKQEMPAEGSEEPSEQEASEEEAPDTPDDESEPEDESEDDEVIHGNKFVVLRDGTKVRVAELKKLYDKAPEFQRKEAEISTIQQRMAAEVQSLQAQKAQIAQQAQMIQELGPVVLAKAQAMMPKQPDPEMMNRNSEKYDPLQYQEDAFHYQQAISEFQKLQHGLTTAQQQKQAELQQIQEQQKAQQDAEFANWSKKQFQELIDERPALKDPAKMKAFGEKIQKGAEIYGFPREQLNTVTDKRVFYALADAADLHALRSQRQAVEKKVAGVPPVRVPGKRQSSAEQAESQRKSVFERANSGSLDDVAAAIAALKL